MHNPNSHLSSNTKAKELSICRLKMRAVQLSSDHSTSIEEVMILLNKSVVIFSLHCHLLSYAYFVFEFFIYPDFSSSFYHLYVFP